MLAKVTRIHKLLVNTFYTTKFKERNLSFQ
jgi:hypothetical protein